MDQDINNHLFIEAGQYNNNLYGTSVASVREVADSGRHCVLDLSGLAIKRLLATGLYPIAILTKPTSPENVMAWTDADANESQKQYEKTLKLEEELKEYFTAIAMGDSPDDVYAAVKDIIQQHSGSNVWVATGEKLWIHADTLCTRIVSQKHAGYSAVFVMCIAWGRDNAVCGGRWCSYVLIGVCVVEYNCLLACRGWPCWFVLAYSMWSTVRQ